MRTSLVAPPDDVVPQPGKEDGIERISYDHDGHGGDGDEDDDENRT